MSGPTVAASLAVDHLPASAQACNQLADQAACALQIAGPTVITTLSISIVWIIYSAIPAYLVIHYTWVGRGTTLQFMCRVAFLLSYASGLCAILLLWGVYPKTYDFSQATNVSMAC